jgi:hypothetical protein
MQPPQASHSLRTLKWLKQQLGPHFCFRSCCCVSSISLLFEAFFFMIDVSMLFIHTIVRSKLFICIMFVFFFVTLLGLCFSFALLGPCFLFLLLLGPMFFFHFVVFVFFIHTFVRSLFTLLCLFSSFTHLLGCFSFVLCSWFFLILCYVHVLPLHC